MGANFFSLPFRLTKNTKLLTNDFSFKLTLRLNWQILSYKKIKLKDTYICTFCRSETETTEHILWDCEIVQARLDDFVTFCSNKIHRHCSFAKKTFILGSCEKKGTVKNLITLQIKYYIYSMRCLNNSIRLNGLFSSIKSLYETS